ncbi:cytidine deaminase [Prosthecobacter fusiformis]|uniref:Cytidine deaminase n=1 Tax=Prosthecobacter fusiformis TaxID=48464 RepID=A0A4V3FED6_9BACT|nr:cytidine deaminase [Prosthecobacter fusiformis]TDU66643.1 cytidine deaminase [Prosthecobacter fusiformis]
MSDLLSQARSAAEKAYAPYSKFQVGCAVETVAGKIYTGCNVENASYGLTVCAERNTLFQAVAAEGPGMKVARLSVICLGHEFPPCGACRQVIAEFSLPGGRTEVTFLQQGQPVTRTIAELLPEAFGL